MNLVGKNLKRALALPALAVSLVWALSSFADPIQLRHYDEVYDDNGHARPAYEGVVDVVSKMDDAAIQSTATATRAALGGHHAVSTMPRVLSRTEFESVIKPGVEQRGKAMIAFLQDLYSGKKEFLSDPNLPSEATIQRILKRNNVAGAKLNPESIYLSYGGDLMRDETGQWRVVEDNVASNLGGIGDLRAHQDSLLASVPALGKAQAFPDSLDFYRERVAYYNKMKSAPDSVVVNLQLYSNVQSQDRLAKNYSGMKIYTANQINAASFKVQNNQAYIAMPNSPGEGASWHKIGYLAFDGATSSLQLPGFKELIAAGKLPTNASPGLDFMGDKELYMYVEAMVRHYLKEEPILKNIPTRRFTTSADSNEIDEKTFKDVKEHPRKNTVKETVNQGGAGVKVGAKEPEKEFSAYLNKVPENPQNFIDQEYMPFPIVGDQISDLRVYGLMTSQGASLISDQPLGRSTPVNDNGKVNISLAGNAQAVVISDQAPMPEHVSPPLQTEETTGRIVREALARDDLLFVRSHLSRLYSSSQSPAELLDHLRGAKLLETLAEHHIKIPLDNNAAQALIDSVKTLTIEKGFTPQDLASSLQLFSLSEERQKSFIETYLNFSAKPSQWLDFIKGITQDATLQTKIKLADALIDQIPAFTKLQPDVQERAEFLKILSLQPLDKLSIPRWEVRALGQAQLAGTGAEYLSAIKYVWADNVSEECKNAFLRSLEKTFPKANQLLLDPKERGEYLDLLKNFQTKAKLKPAEWTKVLKLTAGFSQSPGELIKATSFKYEPNSNNVYMNHAAEVLGTHIDRFIQLNPSYNELTSLYDGTHAYTQDEAIKVMSAALLKSSTPAEYLSVFQRTAESWPNDVAHNAVRDQILQANLDHFLSFNPRPSLEDVEKLKALANAPETVAALKESVLKRGVVQTPEDFVSLCSPVAKTQSGKKLEDQFISDHLDSLLTMPSFSDQIAPLQKMVTSDVVHQSITSRALDHIKSTDGSTADDFLKVTTLLPDTKETRKRRDITKTIIKERINDLARLNPREDQIKSLRERFGPIDGFALCFRLNMKLKD